MSRYQNHTVIMSATLKSIEQRTAASASFTRQLQAMSETQAPTPSSKEAKTVRFASEVSTRTIDQDTTTLSASETATPVKPAATAPPATAGTATVSADAGSKHARRHLKNTHETRYKQISAFYDGLERAAGTSPREDCLFREMATALLSGDERGFDGAATELMGIARGFALGG